MKRLRQIGDDLESNIKRIKTTVSDYIQSMSSEFLHMSKYCGPNTQYTGEAKVFIDKVCKAHDDAYAEYIRNGLNPYLASTKADAEMARALEEHGITGPREFIGWIFAKAKGLLPPMPDVSNSQLVNNQMDSSKSTRVGSFFKMGYGFNTVVRAKRKNGYRYSYKRGYMPKRFKKAVNAIVKRKLNSIQWGTPFYHDTHVCFQEAVSVNTCSYFTVQPSISDCWNASRRYIEKQIDVSVTPDGIPDSTRERLQEWTTMAGNDYKVKGTYTTKILVRNNDVVPADVKFYVYDSVTTHDTDFSTVIASAYAEKHTYTKWEDEKTSDSTAGAGFLTDVHATPTLYEKDPVVRRVWQRKRKVEGARLLPGQEYVFMNTKRIYLSAWEYVNGTNNYNDNSHVILMRSQGTLSHKSTDVGFKDIKLDCQVSHYVKTMFGTRKQFTPVVQRDITMGAIDTTAVVGGPDMAEEN